MNDDELHRLLREAPSPLRVPPSFGRDVWARIEAEEALTFGAALRRAADTFFAWVARPMPALVMTAACAALGAFVGTMAGKPDAAVHSPANEWAYVRSINPLERRAMNEP